MTALLLAGFLALAMWQLWSGPAAEVRMEGIALGPVQLSIHDLAAIFMIASLAAVGADEHMAVLRVQGPAAVRAVLLRG